MPVTNAIVGIDLADKKQMVVVTDHDSKVIARRTFRCRAWDLAAALDWAARRAGAKGWTGVTSWSRRTEDLTFDKTDEKDAVLIARLTAQLRCYVPEPALPTMMVGRPPRRCARSSGQSEPWPGR